MTTTLLVARDCIVYGVRLWLAPVERVFDMIEAKLVSRGIALDEVNPAAGRNA